MMKNIEKFNRAFDFFKKDYAYKMGGTQNVMLPNGKSKFFDDRKVYEGRGAKYNASIRYDIIGDVKVSRKMYSEYLRDEKAKNLLKSMGDSFFNWAEVYFPNQDNDADSKNIYLLDLDGFIEFSEIEKNSKIFDVKRLANTFNISVKDASLLNSIGKTYVFAKSTDGIIYQLYHPSFECNDLSIHVQVVSQSRVDEFNSEEWQSAPFARRLGQTNNDNHFVC